MSVKGLALPRIKARSLESLLAALDRMRRHILTWSRRITNALDQDDMWGTYTGNGSDPQTISLPRAAALVHVYGTPGSGQRSTATAVRGGPQGIRTVEDHTAGDLFQLQLASDGESFSVEGSGDNGLNQDGVTYYYAAVAA